MRFLQQIVPRNRDFFAALKTMAAHAAVNAGMLRDLLADPRAAPALLPPMHDHRKKLDDVWEEVDRLLAEAFIAPIDPEDITQVNAQLHHLGDAIDDAARLFAVMSLGSSQPQSLVMCEHLISATRELAAATEWMKNAAVVRRAAARIREVEREADVAYQSALSALFETTRDPITVLKWKEVYDRVEDLIDMVHHTGNLLDRIAVKGV